MMLPVKTIMEHAHNLYRMSSNLRSIAYDLHIVRVARIIEDRIKQRFLLNYTPQLSKTEWFTFFIYLIFTYIRNFRKLNIMILTFHITLIMKNIIDTSSYWRISVYMYNVYLVYSLLYNVGQSIIYFSQFSFH